MPRSNRRFKMKTGVIDVGGGLRGIYGAGVFDSFIDMGISFDVGIGVSAGSANVASFLAGQKGRNYPFYAEYPFRKEYMSLRNFIFKKSFLDLDYIYSTISNSGGENPLNYPGIIENPADFFVVATDANTGKTKYFTKEDISQDDYSVFKASSAIPVVGHPYCVNDVPYFDGAISDPVPLKKAFEEGCDKVVLILTKPRDTIRSDSRDKKLAKFIKKKYPYAAEGFEKRAFRYNRAVAKAKELEEKGKVLIIAPDDTCGVDTLKKNREALDRLYQKGLKDAEAVRDFLGSDPYSEVKH